jgi:hypothetical protein
MATKKTKQKEEEEVVVSARGGAREGAGRPPSDREFDYVTVRHEKEVIDRLREKYKRGELASILRKKMNQLVSS